MTTVKEINRIAELDQYRSLWSELLTQTPGATFFLTLEWLEAFWKHFGQDRVLMVLIVYSGPTPIGILPMSIETIVKKMGHFKCLTYPLHGWGSFYGPIGPNPAETLAAGFEHIRKSSHQWDLLEMQYISQEDVTLNQTGRALNQAGFKADPSILSYTAIIDLKGTWETYLASHTSKWRNNYKRWQRKLAEKGEVSHIRYRPRGTLQGDDDPRWDLLEACMTIARKSWQASSLDGTTLSHASIQPFIRDVHETAARVGALDLNLLLIDQKPAAFVYNYCFRGWLFGLRIGFDPEVSGDGAGNVLYASIIKDSFERGDTLYDMGPGFLECKEPFKPRIEPITLYTHYHPLKVRAQLVRFKRLAEHRWPSFFRKTNPTSTAPCDNISSHVT